MLGFLLVLHHLLEFRVCLGLLLLEFRSLNAQRLLQHFDLLLRFGDLLETGVKMSLTVLEFVALLMEQVDEVLDKVEEMLRAECQGLVSFLGFELVEALHVRVDVDECVHNGLPMIETVGAVHVEGVG